ncbi:MAG: nicotinate-nucleotide adenylyltransferase [Porticoccaceae bacterium]|nr:nicotinate-nucleotide adenylyltransferase [Pseudomonadales bacterium]MCP5170895.1 nicotinate-nucleotide adenylyltransferase [Pseudomonadales bacterium]MCP5301865.1 nicotinate-nucleotide adenylyltransferase [Pseudomonadales bacterium]
MSIGVFGGTFDPVHIGHLRTALELKARLNLAEMRMIPSAQPPHRDTPSTSAAHRLAMLERAVAGEPGMKADDCELKRTGPSYTIDTLRAVRAEMGAHVPVYLCIGMDALLTINSWQHWRLLLDFAHIVAVARPGWLPPEEGDVAVFIRQHREQLECLPNSACGHIAIAEMTLLPVSATGIRESLKRGESVRYLVPDSVIEYIREQGLYR